MTPTQIKYARERAKGILHNRQAALATEFRDAKVEITVEEKLKALTAGEFTVLPKSKRNYRWYDNVNFNAEVQPDQKAHDRKAAALKLAYQNLEDALVLGDSSEALKLLEDFAKG